jgi:hypothetical protein
VSVLQLQILNSDLDNFETITFFVRFWHSVDHISTLAFSGYYLITMRERLPASASSFSSLRVLSGAFRGLPTRKRFEEGGRGS